MAAVVAELQPLVGAKIQRVTQIGPTSITLGLYPAGGATGRKELSLLVGWNPEFARIHLIRQRHPSAELSPFASAMRKVLIGGRLVFVRQRGFDRIIDIGVAGSEQDIQVSIELMGKHSNVFLVDHHRKILATAKVVSPRQSRRPARPGILYEPPPFEPRPSLLEALPGDDLRNYEGASPFLLQLIQAGMPLEDIQRAAKHHQFNPCFSATLGAYALDLSVITPDAIPRESVSQALEDAWSEREERSAVENARRALVVQLQRVVDARSAAIDALGEALSLADRASMIQREAELILAYQGSIQPGESTVVVYDYDGSEVRLALDPEKTPIENANARFHRARHAKERREEVTDMYSRLSLDLASACAVLESAKAADTIEQIADLRRQAGDRKWLHVAQAAKSPQERPYEGFSVRELISPSGYRVIYGTNATSNDYITMRVAKKDDLWFHVRGQTSAHVILVTAGREARVQFADIQFAALACVRNSVAKHSSHVPVDYTFKKYVRKPRGSAAGMVTYEREKTIHVDP